LLQIHNQKPKTIFVIVISEFRPSCAVSMLPECESFELAFLTASLHFLNYRFLDFWSFLAPQYNFLTISTAVTTLSGIPAISFLTTTGNWLSLYPSPRCSPIFETQFER